MSVYRDPNAPRFFTWGQRVDKAAGLLPQTTTATLFTVAGGRVLITSVVGNVTVATGATATNLKLTSTPTAGTAVDFATNVSVASKEAGSHLLANLVTIGALTVVNAGAAVVPGGSSGLLVPPGVISWTTDANNTGQIKWSLTYIPFDDGSTVS